MVQCLDGVRQLLAVVFKCCDLELKQPRGLEDPQVLARETVCKSAAFAIGWGAVLLLPFVAEPVSLGEFDWCVWLGWILWPCVVQSA
jgi:hypothetical protein